MGDSLHVKLSSDVINRNRGLLMDIVEQCSALNWLCAWCGQSATTDQLTIINHTRPQIYVHTHWQLGSESPCPLAEIISRISLRSNRGCNLLIRRACISQKLPVPFAQQLYFLCNLVVSVCSRRHCFLTLFEPTDHCNGSHQWAQWRRKCSRIHRRRRRAEGLCCKWRTCHNTGRAVLASKWILRREWLFSIQHFLSYVVS